MQVLKVVAEGLTTSFRYPHFMQGIQPSYQMPPPATIYGHICSALGDWIDPSGLAFAYHFTHQGTFDDVEHVHIVAPAGGRLPGTTLPKVLEGAVNPYKRTILFRPKLVLYLNRPEWQQAFRSPHYPVVLGRSQDLFTYTSVSVMELTLAAPAYFEHTLAPYRVTRQTASGYVETMPRYLDYSANRQPTFARYVILDRRVTQLIHFEGDAGPPEHWVDPATLEIEGTHLGLWFHTFTGPYDDTPMA